MDNELTEIYDRLRSAYETVEADLQSRIDANASAYSSYTPEQLRDTQGRYILLDALL